MYRIDRLLIFFDINDALSHINKCYWGIFGYSILNWIQSSDFVKCWQSNNCGHKKRASAYTIFVTRNSAVLVVEAWKSRLNRQKTIKYLNDCLHFVVANTTKQTIFAPFCLLPQNVGKDHRTPEESTRKRTPFFVAFWVSKKAESRFDAYDNSISRNGKLLLIDVAFWDEYVTSFIIKSEKYFQFSINTT